MAGRITKMKNRGLSQRINGFYFEFVAGGYYCDELDCWFASWNDAWSYTAEPCVVEDSSKVVEIFG